MTRAIPPTPEIDKATLKAREMLVLHNFLEWLESKGIHLCEETQAELLFRTFESRESLVAGFLEIDLKKAEEERSAVHEWIKERQYA